MHLRGSDVVLDAVRQFFAVDEPVPTLCQGPQILAAADVLDGYEMTSSPAIRAEVEAPECTWVSEVTTDGNLVTAQAWPDHPEWFTQSLDLLGTKPSTDPSQPQ